MTENLHEDKHWVQDSSDLAGDWGVIRQVWVSESVSEQLYVPETTRVKLGLSYVCMFVFVTTCASTFA